MDPSALAAVPPAFPLDRPFPFFPAAPPRHTVHTPLQPAHPPFPFLPCYCSAYNRKPLGCPYLGYLYGQSFSPRLILQPATAWHHSAPEIPEPFSGFEGGGGGSGDLSQTDLAGELYVEDGVPADQEEEEENGEEIFVLSDEWAEFFAKSEARRRQEKQMQKQQQKRK